MRLTNCRICRSQAVDPFLDLGSTPLADDFLTTNRLSEPESYYPLSVVRCRDCDLVQLDYTVDRTKLYTHDYPYISSTTATGRAHYEEMAAAICRDFGVRALDLVVDIGSNVGVLLKGFKQAANCRVLGVEPVPPIAHRANLSGIETLTEFFDFSIARQIASSRGKATVITGTNVVAHIHDLNGLFYGIGELLHPGGVFVFEAPYLLDLVGNLAYDTIYHEHLSYLAVRPIRRLCAQNGLELIDVEHFGIHGGTLRYTITHERAAAVRPSVTEYARRETLLDRKSIRQFAADVNAHRRDLTAHIIALRAAGHSVAAISAPAKGNTLLNVCGLNSSLIDFVTEKESTKINRWTPGTRIPVLSDDALIDFRPDYALLLAWNFAEEIKKNCGAYSRAGGQFITPLPIHVWRNRTGGATA